MSDIQLIHGDCLIEIKKLILNKVMVDAVIVDPPYLIRYKTNRRKNKNHKFCKEICNDSYFDFLEWAKLINRLLKKNSSIYIFTKWTMEPYIRSIMSLFWNHKNNIIWVKNNWTAGDLKSQYGQQYEIISLYNKGRSFLKGNRHSDVWYFNRVVGNKQLHQNQKPIGLIKKIIKSCTNKGDLVIDTFLGSGTCGVACKQLERKFIGIEIDGNEFNIAKNRIFNTPIGFINE